jgi:serine/threonine protein kinase
MAFEVGQRVGDYEVVKMLGIGGMGHVYLVRNIISNRTEAMKVLLPDLTAERDLAMRFISEIRTLAGFDHPNIAQLRTAYQANNQLIMIMEFVEGSTLEQMAITRPLTVQETAGYISQALSALGYAHEHGVVHRDIKPANLMVTSHGIVKLMDFGIAKSANDELQQTRPGTTIGSLHYMSPEQVRGGTIDARSDLYSVGVLLYELSAGRRPFEADTTFSILNQQLNVEPTPPIEFNPELPAGLNQIIMKALAKDPDQRYQTANEFRQALKAFRVADAPAATTVMPVPTPLASMPPASAPPMPMPIPAVSAATAPTQIMGASTPPPAFSTVPNTAPPPAYNYAASAQQPPQQIPHSTPIPPPSARSGGHRGLWIATGALVVLLVLVGVGFALPHIASTFAGSRAALVDTSSASSQPAAQETASTPQPATQQASTSAVPESNTTTSAPQTASNNTAPIVRSGNSSPAPHSGNQQTAGSYSPATNTPTMNHPASQPANETGIEEAQERYTQLLARSNAARRGIDRIRKQQEADGLGMRGDIEASDSRLGSYISTASSALARGDSAAAQRAMDKAEPDLTTVEKFLGH